LLKSLFLLLFPQEQPCLVTAIKAGYYYVRLPFLFYPHPAIGALNKQRIAVLADLAPVYRWQPYFCGHSYFTCSLDVAAGKLRIITVDFFSLLKKNLDSLSCNLFCGWLHFDTSLSSCIIQVAINLLFVAFNFTQS
jgi:hypothetical protein